LITYVHGDGAAHVGGVKPEFAVALVRVEVADVDSRAVDVNGADQRRTGSDFGDIHVAVGALL